MKWGVYMARYSNSWDEDKKQKLIFSGRGQGVGSEYQPWITVQDFPSMGRVSRIYGWKTKRIHHLLSDIQTKYFYLLEFEESVVDIRENYPLLDIESVIKEKEDLDFDIFTNKESQTPYVISTSFLITLKDKNGDLKYAARSIKAASELEKKKTLEKLEIERRYWNQKNIDWGIVTQKEIPKQLVKNIEWIHSSKYDFEERGITEKEVQLMCAALKDNIIRRNEALAKIISEFDYEYNYQSGTGLYLFKYLIASKKLNVDMKNEININKLSSSDIVVPILTIGGNSIVNG
jgi:hypothetical protein